MNGLKHFHRLLPNHPSESQLPRGQTSCYESGQPEIRGRATLAKPVGPLRSQSCWLNSWGKGVLSEGQRGRSLQHSSAPPPPQQWCSGPDLLTS